MPSNADLIIQEARKCVGHSERAPQLDNIGTANPPTYSAGSWIVNKSIEMGGYGSSGGVPWCGAYCIFVGERAGVQSHFRTSKGGMSHGYTGEIERVARSRGWVQSRGVPGCLAVKPTKHVTIVTAVHSDGTYTTVGGNESDRVSERRQTLSGYIFCVPPDLGTASGGGGAPVKYWAFQRLDIATGDYAWGGWPTPQQRDEQMALALARDPNAWARPYKDPARKSPYVFETGPKLDINGKKTWNTPAIFGGWSAASGGAATRDAQMAAFEAKNPGIPLRPFSYTKAAPTTGPPASGVEGDVKFT